MRHRRHDRLGWVPTALIAVAAMCAGLAYGIAQADCRMPSVPVAPPSPEWSCCLLGGEINCMPVPKTVTQEAKVGRPWPLVDSDFSNEVMDWQPDDDIP